MPRILPSLTGLQAFEATARHGTVSRAADELLLTQSAVSRHIQQLEARLGVALFSRKAKRLHLTEAGSAYLAEVRTGLESINTATLSLMASRGHTGSLSVATLPTFGANWLIPRLPRFRALHPGISLHLSGRPEPFDFAFERVDCAIHFGGPEWPGADMDYLFKETSTAIACPSIATGIAELGDLLDWPLLHISSRPFAWREWLASIARFRALPDDLLVLPGHGDPFYGLHARLDALAREHHDRLDALVAFMDHPRRAVDCFPHLFRRPIGPDVIGMATGEALAHLRHLEVTGRARRAVRDGIWWYSRA